ncbi:transposase [Bradyrhizobium sp. CCBAU 11430]|uniref:transposase n=1 Tax=Bradyrhizobium sp. CCBAU 11430 TaxID=1630881 RepID=UPI003FA4B0FB
MLAGLLTGIVDDRKLIREAQVHIAIRWFVGYGLHEQLPHHSSLTRIRQRAGAKSDSVGSLSARSRPI